MRLLHRSPETPSLETWLGRDVPHERELASQLLDRMGREKSLMVLLALYDKEETKRMKRLRFFAATHWTLLSISTAVILAGIILRKWFNPSAAFILGSLVGMFNAIIYSAAGVFGYANPCKASQRQKNIVTALFDYDDNTLIADPLCRAIAYHDDDDRWEVFAAVMRVLPLLPDEKDALTKEARRWLRNSLVVMEARPVTEAMHTERARYADFEIAVLRYFARTRDKNALPAIRKLAKSKPFSNDGRRVQDAARAALQAFSEPAA